MIRYLKQSDMMKCPDFIMLPNHYREDGTCRHNEPNCEFDDLGVQCQNLKYYEEIFCRKHLEFYGEFEDA
jgi:hypothetical protein